MEIIRCACGCGTTFAKYDQQGRPRRFINGHNARGNKYRLGIKHPESFKQMMSERMSGENHPQWQGGRVNDERGYVLIHTPEHPHKKHGNYVYEHRLVLEEHLGRYLESAESVHHINGNTSDNRIENLKLFSSDSEHAIFEGRGSPEALRKATKLKSKKAAERWTQLRSIMIFCACGCGELIHAYDKKLRSRKFKHGHGRWKK